MGKRPPYKNRKGKGKLKDIKEEDQAKARQQKLYHYQKQLHKAIKKAKEFEIRKVSRRLKHARESQDKDGGTIGGQAAAVQKLQDQLEAVKAIGLDGLTKEAAGSLVKGTSVNVEDSKPEQQEAQAVMLVRARILSAKCVQETLAAAWQALARLEAGARQPAAAAELPAAAPDLAPGSGASDGTPELASSGHAASVSDTPEAPSSSNGEVSEDGEERTAAKRRKLLEGGGEASTGPKKQPKPPPKKKKNRLGQRARKLLAEAPPGGVPATQGARPGPRPQLGQPTGQVGRPGVTVAQQRHPPAGFKTDQLSKKPTSTSQQPKQGKVTSGAKEQEQLHPSWAAKKAMADRGGLMAPSQGTKLVFGDDD